MNTKRLSKGLALILASMLLGLGISSPAEAVTVYLVRCQMKFTNRGNTIYVGTYRYRGELYQMIFDEYCPNSVELEIETYR